MKYVDLRTYSKNGWQFMRSSYDEQPKLDRFGDGLRRGDTIQLVMNGLHVIAGSVRRNAQDRGDCGRVFAERDPAQTLKLPRCQARPIFAKKLQHDTAMQPVGDVDQGRLRDR